MLTWSKFRKGQALRREANNWRSKSSTVNFAKTVIHVLAYCYEWIKKSTLTKRRFRCDFVGALYNASAKLAISFCLWSPCWFCWMRTEVADNWFAVVDRFAASSLRMICRSNRVQMHFADFGERLCDIVKRCKHLCLTSSLVDVFKPYRL